MRCKPSHDEKQEPFNYTIPKQGDRWRARDVIPFLSLPDCAKRVLLVLVDRCNDKTGQCDPAGGRLAHDCGSPDTGKPLSDRATWKGIAVLEQAGLIRRLKIGRQQVNAESFAYGNDAVMVKTNWARNSYQIDWARLNQLHAARVTRRNSFRRVDSSPISKKDMHERAQDACTIVHTPACTIVQTNLERGTSKENLETTLRAGDSFAFGDDADMPVGDDDGEA